MIVGLVAHALPVLVDGFPIYTELRRDQGIMTNNGQKYRGYDKLEETKGLWQLNS